MPTFLYNVAPNFLRHSSFAIFPPVRAVQDRTANGSGRREMGRKFHSHGNPSAFSSASCSVVMVPFARRIRWV